MITVQNQLEQVVFDEVSEINGENTDRELNVDISKLVVNNKLTNTAIKSNLANTQHMEHHGAWVYMDRSIDEWEFSRYNTIADAVKQAIKEIGAKIICDGQIIDYDALDDSQAYYIDSRTSKIGLVTI